MIRAGVIAVLMTTAAPLAAQTDDAPLSAIDWLSQSVEQPETIAVPVDPVLGTQATRTPPSDETPVADTAAIPQVTVQPLGAPAPRALGLLSSSATGFSETIWSGSETDTLAALLQAEQIDTLPALQDVLISLSLTQAAPPFDDATGTAFFLARVDKLLAFGALEPAQAMLEEATPDTSALFRRWFDVSLLTGTEDSACRSLRGKPDVAPTPSARVFCLARTGDWAAAALTLNTGSALGDIDAPTADLLARFLDPDLFEGEPPLTAPERITPLTFRMFEAVGEPLTTSDLPRAFSHADLRDNVGWKAKLEAAERLARSGAIDENTLVGLYTSRVPSASGGVWERARAVADLSAALEAGDPDAISDAVNAVWLEGRNVGVLVPLARYFAPRLIEAAPQLAADQVLFKMLLLSDLYETAALDPELAEMDPFLAALATGDPSDALAIRPAYPIVREAFAADPDAALMDLAASGRSGEAILRAIATLQQGIDGDRMAFREGFATLRALGLEDTARRAALQYAILP